MIGLEALARAIAYGAVRGYLDALRDAQLASIEEPTDADKARADRFRASVAERMRNAAPREAKSFDPTPDQSAG